MSLSRLASAVAAKRPTNLHIALDLSASIPARRVAFLQQATRTLAAQTGTNPIVMGFDTTVFYRAYLSNIDWTQIRAERGGTLFDPVLQAFTDNKADVGVILTDMMSHVPAPAAIPIFWGIEEPMRNNIPYGQAFVV